jgi:uncharacterized protein (DUF2141 family)
MAHRFALARAAVLAPMLVAALAAASLPAHALDLTIEVTGARSARGAVSAALYNSAEGWLKQPLAAERVAAGDKVLLVFRNLAAGNYAFAVIHDENGNGKLDTNVSGVPIEAYGFSRDAKGAFGPPKFPAAALDLQADATVKVVLQ